MIKKKSNVRKYSRKVKNKKVKYSKKLMSGGALLSPSSSQKPKLLQPHQSQRQPLVFKFNKPFETKIMELYEFSKLEADKDYISQIFRKFKYSYAQTNPAYKETDSILYLKKDEVDKEINPTEVFKVYAPTNQSISIEYNDDKKFKDIGKFYEITPLELSVDTMQLAVNTGKLEISTDKDGNSYLGFVDFPSLVITEKPSGTGFSYSSRKNATWISVYEQEFEEKDKLFDLIETMDGRHIEQSTFDSEIETIDVKISKLDKTIYKDSVKIRKLEELKPKKKGDVPMANEELFIKKQEEMRILLSEPESDEKAKLKLKIEEQVKYRAYVKLEEDGDGSNKNVITEDISWAMKNSLWLEEYLKIKTEDNSLTAQELKTKIGEEYECDLSGLDEKYVIVDEFENKVENGGDGETYVICGYPERQMKEHILNFWQDEKMKIDLNKVHKEQKDNFYEWFSKLFNEFVNLDSENSIKKTPHKLTEIIKQKQFNTINIKKNKSNLNELYKIFYKSIEEPIVKYIKDRYNQTIAEPNNTFNLSDVDLIFFRKNLIKFNKKWETNIQTYFNDIAQQYLNTIISNITYVFLVFKKNKYKLQSLNIAFFNVKELEIKYKPLLERINKLIKNEIPIIFNIKQIYKDSSLNIQETKITKLYNSKNTYIPNITDKYNYDNEYKLFYTYHTYGKLFYLNTKIFNTMENLNYKAHKYKNNITLEELIYSCSLISNNNNPFWKDVKINYDIRNYKLTILQSYRIKQNLNNRTDILFKELDKYYPKIKKEKVKETILSLNLFKEGQILLMYRNSSSYFIFIYMSNNKFYKLILQPNLHYILDDIISELHNNIINDKNNIIFSMITKLFRVLYNNILNNDSIKEIFAYNPLQSKQLINPKFNDNNKIDVTLYYECEMKKTLDTDDNHIEMPNLYQLDHSQFYIDYIDNNLYTKRQKLYESLKINILTDCKFNITSNEPLNNNNLQRSYEKLSTLINQNFKKKFNLNCVFINVDNCGYDFLEFINIEDNKLLILIFPNKKLKYSILGNFMSLNTSSSKMLLALKNKYYNNNYLFFMHYQLVFKNYTLHLHIIKKDYYKRPFPQMELEMGSFILKALYFDKLFNFYNTKTDYYQQLNKNLNFSIINPIF